MLKATTEEQRQRIEEILRADDPCNYLEWGDYYDNEYDCITFDGEISFNDMAAIVDYLRACSPEKK